jgi:apolipoprotein N-acyltransferase
MGQLTFRRSHIFKDLSLAVISAVLLALSFPKFDLEFLAWFAFIFLFSALEKSSKTKAFLLSFTCGAVFWSVTIWWLVHVTLLGTIVLILYLSLFFGAFGLALSGFLRSRKAQSIGPGFIFFSAAAWLLLEYGRSRLFTGFPWALLGYSQYLNLPAIQVADIFGAWGVSFLLVMFNAALYSVIRGKSAAAEKTRYLIAPVIILALVFGYGYFRLQQAKRSGDSAKRAVNISVIQGNILQELKWQPQARQEIMDKYLMLSRQAAKEKPDLIVWPEAAIPVILEEEPAYYEMVRNLAEQAGTPFLFGAVTSREGGYYNSCLMVSQEGETIGRYDKLHLVPFGEYIPLRAVFPFLETIVPIGDVNPGQEYALFSVQLPGVGHSLSSKFGVLICFEDVFPELSRQFVRKGAQFLVNITNDAWYKQSFASYQHFQASVLRAVENRISVLRSANTGVSGFISPEGRIVSLVKDASGRDLFVDGYKMERVLVKKGGKTLYTKFGDSTIISLCLLIVLITLLPRPIAKGRD